jgi:hypothetical protein
MNEFIGSGGELIFHILTIMKIKAVTQQKPRRRPNLAYCDSFTELKRRNILCSNNMRIPLPSTLRHLRVVIEFEINEHELA